MNFRHFPTLPTLATLLLLPAISPAGMINVPIEVADQQVDTDGNLSWVGQPSIRVGKTSQADPIVAWDAVLPFALPGIPGDEEITAAILTVNLEGWVSYATIGPVLVYGINMVSDVPTVVYADHYVDGRVPDVNANAVLLDPDLITKADLVGNSASAQTMPFVTVDISSYVSNLYSGLGAIAGQFSFITLAVDVNTVGSTSNNYYTISSANSATPEWQPFLTITTTAVPEPSMAALVLGIAALGYLGWRRIR